MDRSLWLRVYSILFLALASSGCEVVEGIFKVGMWVGIIMVVAVVALIMFVMRKMKS